MPRSAAPRCRAITALLLAPLLAGCWQRQALTGEDGTVGVVLDGGAADGRRLAPDTTVLPDLGPPRQPRWTELGQGGAPRPPGRMNHFAVYDEAQDRMLVFGGYDPYLSDGGCCVDPYRLPLEVWQLDLASDQWSQVGALTKPLLAVTPTEVALDRPRHRLVVVGATVDALHGGMVHVALDLGSWAMTDLPGGPWPPGEHPLRAAWDREGGRVVVHGAYSTIQVEGVWVLDLASDVWSTVSVPEPHPGFRYHSPLTATGDGRAYLYSGYSGEGPSPDWWELDLGQQRWRLIPLGQELLGRWSHRAVFEPRRGLLVVYGGSRWGAKGHLGVELIAEHAFTQEDPVSGQSPPGRRDHSMVLDSRRRRALVYGGAFESDRVQADVWALELP